MASSIFRFKQFVIQQDRCAMKVGTDGILLGSWTNCENRKTILDIGTGTGLLSLMLAQRCEAKIHCIEPDYEAFTQASENIGNSLWFNRITIEWCSVQEFVKTYSGKFDLIITNPPYYINSLKNPDKLRTLARHNDTLNHNDILSASDFLLNETGSLSIILPYIEGNIFIAEAANYKFFCTQKTNVITSPGKPAKRLLLRFDRNKENIIENQIIVETGMRHHYSQKFRELTKDFYLSFKNENEKFDNFITKFP